MTEPRLTLKIAVYTIIRKNNKILFLRRRNTGWSDGLFCLPAGHVDPHEKPIIAAIRETLEETGIIVKENNLKFAHVMFRKDKYVDFFFEASSCVGKPKIAEPEKSDLIAWLNPKKDKGKIIPLILTALEKIDQNISYSEITPND